MCSTPPANAENVAGVASAGAAAPGSAARARGRASASAGIWQAFWHRASQQLFAGDVGDLGTIGDVGAVGEVAAVGGAAGAGCKPPARWSPAAAMFIPWHEAGRLAWSSCRIAQGCGPASKPVANVASRRRAAQIRIKRALAISR
jgi:hypothetical protein